MPRLILPSNRPPRRSWIPRPVHPLEAEVIRQLLKVDAHRQLGEWSLQTWLATVDHLIVREGCDLGSDSLFFDHPRRLGRVIASGVGRSADQSDVEVVLWARGPILTFLELEPYGSRTRYPPRLPRPESIGPYPPNPGDPDDPEQEEQSAVKPLRPINTPAGSCKSRPSSHSRTARPVR